MARICRSNLRLRAIIRTYTGYVGLLFLLLYLIKSVTYLQSADDDDGVDPYYVDSGLTAVQESRRVLLLSYQRCGSSFTGQILNHNPDAYYVFEPLDAFYASLYGTSPGWNVPSDITNHWNGSARTMPKYELKYMAKQTNALLSCDTQRLPTEFFTHSFWVKFPGSLGRLSGFKKCLTRIKGGKDHCYTRLRPFCPERFGQDPEHMKLCFEHLQGYKKTSVLMSRIEDYRQCVGKERQKVKECIQQMNVTCHGSYIRSTKTVRLSMATVEYMLTQDPDLKVIHLFRDPRAVALSRMSRSSFRGKFSGKDTLLESQLYCRTVLNDIIVRKRLEKQYPNTFYQLIYDDFVEGTVDKTRQVYKFLNLPFPEEVEIWLHQKQPHTNDSMKIAAKWQDKLSFRLATRIRESCEELFEHANGVWD